ncbi:unnamed protein product [Thlaspi arvense]|uniref:Polygalacturonase n=1 Tax=Thlaspi arvense TaxID=13288 RepID=A0AAU9RYB6_THLAR|nr:unnamed protein product [Thlaspi arvense]
MISTLTYVNVVSLGAKPDGKTDSARPSSRCGLWPVDHPGRQRFMCLREGTWLERPNLWGNARTITSHFVLTAPLWHPPTIKLSEVTTLGFTKSNNVVISGLTSLNSQMFHLVINGCRNVKLQGVKISAVGDSPNTDGIHVQMSSDVSIFNSRISTGDDCVSIGAGTSNLQIQNVSCGPRHGH